jgi:hypothetical protein
MRGESLQESDGKKIVAAFWFDGCTNSVGFKTCSHKEQAFESSCVYNEKTPQHILCSVSLGGVQTPNNPPKASLFFDTCRRSDEGGGASHAFQCFATSRQELPNVSSQRL